LENDNPIRPTPSSSGVLLVLLLVSAGVTAGNGSFCWHGLILIASGLALAIWIHVRPACADFPVEGFLLGLVLAFIAASVVMKTGIYERVGTISVRFQGRMRPLRQLNTYGRMIHILSGIGLIAAVTYLWRAWDRRRRIAAGRFVLLLLIALVVRGLMLKSSPDPRIDVFTSQSAGAKGLLLQLTPKEQRQETLQCLAETPAEAHALQQRRNVYAMTFPSPYKNVKDFDHYGYPPPTIYVNALSWLAFKDVRVGWLWCDLLGALCIYLLAARMSPGPKHRRFRELLTLAFLFMPRSLYVLEQSWTEPLVVASLGVLALLLARPSNFILRGVAMAVWFGSKQYVVLALPLLVRLRRCRLAAWIVAAVVGMGLFLPFALWDWDAMYQDLAGFFLRSEGRPDALSIYGAVKRYGHEIPWWVVAPLWLGGVSFFTCKMKRTLASMLFSVASLWLYFFILGKQAFMNYWYLILFTLLLAVAATPQKLEAGDADATGA